ncbi:hypothetical protein [Vibrio breoganii]|uniref:hypothetical protein n=1 Tax=Vibrio breoganii TaxID=553239 RepID=UPI000C822DC1|nr:hypothetical protein [Vibrio breoganii]PMM18160.1 hypothetical protein BCT59_01445 [Vibrio breoganii]
MKNWITLFSLALVMTGCTSVQYNGGETIVSDVDYPAVGKKVTVYVGDHMVEKGTITEEDALVVHQHIDGALYDIPSGKYKQVGYDSKQYFYSGLGVIRGGLSDPVEALAVAKKTNADICVVTVFGNQSCYKGHYDRERQFSERGNSFQQTLIYNGRVGDKINIGYREYSNNRARPAFSNEVEYDLSASKTIAYKGAVIEVIDANNSSITYKLIRNFPN